MTVAANDTIERYVISGAGPYPFSWRVFNNSDLQVYALSLAVPPVPTLLALNTHYTVTGANDLNGGSITLLTTAFTPYAGYTLDIRANTPEDQPTSIRNQARFLPEIHEDAYDYLSRQIQDLRRLVNEKVGAPDYEPALALTLPSVAARAGKFQAFDSFGQPIASSGTGADAGLRSDLAATTSGADGARLVGYRRTATSLARSVALALITTTGVNLADFVTDFTGATDQIANLNLAATFAASSISTSNSLFHPGGNIRFDSQFLLPQGVGIRGAYRDACKFTFNGSPGTAPAKTRSAIRYESGNVNTGQFSDIHLEHIWLFYANSINFSGGIELNAGGGSYYSLNNVRVSGFCSYGLVLDAVELGFAHDCLFENVSGITTGANIYITNGAARTTGQGLGWSNVITISDCQLAGGGAAAGGGSGAYGIIDEGGNEHTITGCNFDGHRFAASFAAVTNLTLHGNSFETPLLTGSSNVQFSNLDVSGANVGPCMGVSIRSCGFFGNMSAGSLLQFTSTNIPITNITKAANAVVTVNTVSANNPFFVGYPMTLQGVVGMTEINLQSAQVSAIGGVSGAWTATIPINSTGFSTYVSGGVVASYHSGVSVQSCFFGSQLGRGGAIDVTYMGNGYCGPNFDAGNASMTHYVGVHNDALGNTLYPPQNGFPGGVGINGPTYGDSRFRHNFYSAIQYASPATIPYSASMNFDLKTANSYEITPNNATAMTLNSPANAVPGNKYSVWFINTTGGALGALTPGGSMRLAGAWTQPATGNRRRIEFEVNASGISYESYRSPTDVPN